MLPGYSAVCASSRMRIAGFGDIDHVTWNVPIPTRIDR